MKAKSKSKAKKVTVKKIISRKVVTKSNSSMGMWMMAVLIVLLGLVGLKKYNAMYSKPGDVNVIAQPTIIEYPIAHWTFDNNTDFKPTGVAEWTMSAASLASMRMTTFKDGVLELTYLNPSSQLVSKIINLPLTEDLTLRGNYVVKVKAGVVEQVKPNLYPGQAVPLNLLPEFPKHDYQMKVELIDVYLVDKSDHQETRYRVLDTLVASAKTNDGQKEYEFVVSKILPSNINRIRFYLYDNAAGAPLVATNKLLRPVSYDTTTTMYLDDISIVKRAIIRSNSNASPAPLRSPIVQQPR